MKKRIVIIDDDSRNIFAIKATLQTRNFECITFLDASKAIEYLDSQHMVDALLIDMMMPEIDGYEAISLIRKIENRKNLPIISVTAQAMKGDKEKCLHAGADHYLSKPIDVDRLLVILSTI